MKLLFCDKCGDVRKLQVSDQFTSCQCGRVMARYADDINAEWNGVGYLLGFNNSSLASTVKLQRRDGDLSTGRGRVFEAFVIPESAPSVKREVGNKP